MGKIEPKYGESLEVDITPKGKVTCKNCRR